YGLAAYIWTSDLKRSHNFAQNVEAGMAWLNSNNVPHLRTPFGGVKASGLGHEGDYRSIDFYTDQQAVHINLGEVNNQVFGKQTNEFPHIHTTLLTSIGVIMTEVQVQAILRSAYIEIVATELAKSREFYVDVLGLVVTEEEDNEIELRPMKEFIHHNI